MADPTPINENFNYLDGKINTVSANINTQYANLQSQISTVNSSLSSSISSLSDIANPTINTLSTSGTIVLSDNSINTIKPNGAVTFTLPTVSDNTKLHQILVQIKLSTVYSINVGTTYYFNKKAPDMSATGYYNLIYEYDKQYARWVCGCMKKGTV